MNSSTENPKPLTHILGQVSQDLDGRLVIEPTPKVVPLEPCEPEGSLSPKSLREMLDRWCEEQRGVIRFVDDPMFDPGWEAKVWSPKCDISPPDQGASFYWESVATALDNGGAITFDVKDWYLLNYLAIEHHYTPWLRFAASLPYTGAKAARLALRAFDKGLAETEPADEPDAKPLTDDGAMEWD